MGVGIAEEGVDGGGAEGVVAAGDDFVEVDEADVLLLGDLLGPAAVSVGAAVDFIADPDLARDERAEDGGGSFGADVGDVLAEIPAVGVDGFDLVGDGVFYVVGFFADAGEAATSVGAAGTGSGGRSGLRRAGREALVGDGRCSGKGDAAVVMAPLDKDDVAGLDDREGEVPMAAGNVAVGGLAADSAVDDVDFGGIEEVGDGRPPSPEAVGAEAVAVADGGVSDEDERGEIGVGRVGEAETLLLGCGVGLGARGWGRGGGSGGGCGWGCGWWRGLLRGDGEEREEAGGCGG